ncbi:hypothetical protein ACJRO7_031641 [Eucalyptus globulus]|uniref:Uncharacterized protein n=1 Tax=Eucalyptus globulus TaxID=34317 RepID=A0ABD3JKT6_EUCGL
MRSLPCSVLVLLLRVLLIHSLFLPFTSSRTTIQRGQFPPSFLFGTATSSFQIEGAYLQGNKSPSNWDVFSHIPRKIEDGSNVDVTDDHYNLFMVLDFLNTLIKHSSRSIKPFVTLNHFDIPQVLEDQYGSWLSSEIELDFGYFAQVRFEAFGDRVTYWTTFNEPNMYIYKGYILRTTLPSRCSYPLGNCSYGDSTLEPHIATHNLVLSHPGAAEIYQKFQEKQEGVIGIVIAAPWFVPYDDTPADRLAVERSLAFYFAWFADPSVYGDYPPEMRQVVGSRLPAFSAEERTKLLEVKLDFIGVNHYTTLYVKDVLLLHFALLSRGGMAMSNFSVIPRGMEGIVTYVKERYNNTPMFITENGYAQPTGPIDNSLNDTERIEYHESYLAVSSEVMRCGGEGIFHLVSARNFEWLHGYLIRFGLHYVDFRTLQSTPKWSATRYKEFLSEDKQNSSDSKNIHLQNVASGIFKTIKLCL